ncbi:MAG: hypothetical protein RL341_1555 [Pseudomonadota bacterium]|jgi:exodeoxyribonuclease VII large subunit
MRGLSAEPSATRTALTVSQFVQAVAQSLARNYPLVRVSGEISGATRAASGHWYFNLKDAGASVRCVLFKNRALLIGDRLRDGDQVEIRARAGLYEPRGEFQLIVDSMQAAGQGDLLAAFLRLKEKLQAQGLFDAARKRALPVFVRRVGIVTSRDAAALRDVVTTFARRAPNVQLILYPATVQGANAPRELLAAVQAASSRGEVDVLIICRGGGALEDLAAFNDEALALAIAAAPMPVISGVGHETDFSISDFVSDVRAPTPTAAAELAARAQQDWLAELDSLVAALGDAAQAILDTASQRLDRAAQQLRHPGQTLALQRSRLAMLAAALRSRAAQAINTHHMQIATLHAALNQSRPTLAGAKIHLEALTARLARVSAQSAQQRSQRLGTLTQQLAALDPTRVLQRGYTYVTNAGGNPVTAAAQTASGDVLTVHWKDGARDVKVQGG